MASYARCSEAWLILGSYVSLWVCVLAWSVACSSSSSVFIPNVWIHLLCVSFFGQCSQFCSSIWLQMVYYSVIYDCHLWLSCLDVIQRMHCQCFTMWGIFTTYQISESVISESLQQFVCQLYIFFWNLQCLGRYLSSSMLPAWLKFFLGISVIIVANVGCNLLFIGSLQSF